MRPCYVTGTVTVSDTFPSSSRVRVAVVNVTSTMFGVHWLFEHVGVGGRGSDRHWCIEYRNEPFRGVGSGVVVPATVTDVS